MKKKQKEEIEDPIRKRFAEMTKEELEEKTDKVTQAIFDLGHALEECGFNNSQCVSMLAFTVATIIEPPHQFIDMFCEEFVKELKMCYKLYNNGEKGSKPSGKARGN